MTSCSWIVCERGGRWTPALRLALERDAAIGGSRHRLREVRHLAELAAELADLPTSITAIEVHRGNLADVLTWLASAERRFPRARCIAFCDRSLVAPEITDSLRETGALEVAHSPRQLRAVLEFGRRHATAIAEFAAEADENGPLSITARAWASLPWQDA